MKISLFQGILFGVFGLVALAGLFVFATYTSNNAGPETIGKVVIWGTLPSEGIQSMLTQAAQTDTVLKDVSYVQKNALTLVADLASAIATGAAPDLVLASGEQLRALAKFITPIPLATLSARTFANAFVQEAGLLSAPAAQGYYGVPFALDPLVLFWNRAILTSSGIAKPPSTWEAVTGLVPSVANFTSTRQVTRGLIALGTYDNVRSARGILSTLFLQQGIPLSAYTTNGSLAADLGKTSASGKPSGQAVLSFYTQFADPSKVSYTWNSSLPNSQQMFLSGDLALYLGYASEARFLSSANPNLDFDVAPVPQPATAPTKSVHGLLYSFHIPRGAANVSGAYRVALLLAGPAEQTAMAAATGLAPVSLTVLSSAPADPVAAVAYAEALYAKGWLSPEPLDTNGVFSSMIGNVISGRSTPETALIGAENALTSLLQQ
jgi:ABC-type glycerol-3-phosphate transport system substrate-binding protein